MRIKDKTRFVIGVIDLFGGIICLIASIYLHRGAKIALTFVPIICGVISLMRSIETKKQRQKRKEELKKFFEG
jgi:energy-converting hydrogenase Eha subunit C